MVKYTMELSWKEHAVDLEALEVWLKANAGADYCGNSAGAKLELHFEEAPSQGIKDAINVKWEELDDEIHAMCASYKPMSERMSDKAVAKAAAIAALATAAGLTQDQIKAMLS